MSILGDLRKSLTQRQDVMLTAHRALETLSVDLLVVMGECWVGMAIGNGTPTLVIFPAKQEITAIKRPYFKWLEDISIMMQRQI